MHEDEPSETESPLFEATKVGVRIDLKRDPDADTRKYMVIEGPGMLVLFPRDGRAVNETPAHLGASRTKPPPRDNPDRDAHFLNAFQVLNRRVALSSWTAS